MTGKEYEEFFKHPEVWDKMTISDFEKMCYHMSSNPYEEWNKKLMRDEDYIKMMCMNKGIAPDHGMLQGLKDMDSKKFHKIISFIKSGIRIIACLAGAMGKLETGFALLLVAEIFGIIEEFKE